MSWNKKNLVTLSDNTDIWKCDVCGFEKKYFGLKRDPACPKCEKEENRIVGAWGNKNNPNSSKCPFCESNMIEVTADHELGKFLYLKRTDDEILQCCPNECREKTGRKKRFIRRS